MRSLKRKRQVHGIYSLGRTIPVVADRYPLSYGCITEMVQVGLDKLRKQVLQVVGVYQKQKCRRGVGVLIDELEQQLATDHVRLAFKKELTAVLSGLRRGQRNE